MNGWMDGWVGRWMDRRTRARMVGGWTDARALDSLIAIPLTWFILKAPTYGLNMFQRFNLRPCSPSMVQLQSAGFIAKRAAANVLPALILALR